MKPDFNSTANRPTKGRNTRSVPTPENHPAKRAADDGMKGRAEGVSGEGLQKEQRRGRRTGTRTSTPEAQAIDRAVGRRLRELRLMRGLSQAMLAETVGVSFQQMQKYERGTNRLSASRLVMIARALAARPEELLPGSFGQAGDDGEVALSAKAIRLARMFDEIASEGVRDGLYATVRASTERP